MRRVNSILLLSIMVITLFQLPVSPNPATLHDEIDPTAPIAYAPPAVTHRDSLSKTLQSPPDPVEPFTTTIASVCPYNASYKPRFLARTKAGVLFELTADELNSYDESARAQIWAVGIKTKFGIVAFYVNDEDSIRNHGQVIIYPVFANGSLPAPTKPISATFMRLWMRVGSTWYQNYITDGALYAANSLDIRQIMVATNTSGTLSLGWQTNLTIQGFEFTINNTLLIENTFLNTVQLKHKVISLDRDFDGMGWEYIVTQSSYYKNTDWELMYGTATNSTYRTQIKFSDYVDVTQTVPNHYNCSTLLTAHNHTMHTFDWDTLKATGFTNALFRVEQFLLPTETSEYVLRVGMYAITNVPQDYAVIIDPTITITEDDAGAIPLEIKRDASDRIYVLGKNSSTTELVVWHSTDNGETWTDYTIGTTRAGDSGGSLVIGSYSGTEYVWVITQISWTVKVFRSATGSTLSFSEIDSNASHDYFTGSATLAGEVLYYVHIKNTDWDNFHIRKSTNGGDTSSEVSDTLYDGTSATAGAAITYDGTYLHLFWTTSSGSETVYSKRLTIADDNVQFYNTTSTAWEDSIDSSLGLSIGNSGKNLYADSDANIIALAGSGLSRAVGHVSINGGETWTASSGIGYHNYLYTCVSVLSNSSVVLTGSNYDSSSNDINLVIYDYSETSWGSWSLIWDSGETADIVDHTVVNQDSDYVDIAYRWLADTNSTYHLKFNQYEAGGGVADETAPSFVYAGTTNSSTIELGTAFLGNWSITEANPSKYIIYANTTSHNVSKVSGSYVSGNYYNWTFANTNASLVDKTIFIEIWANDTSSNNNSSIVYIDIVDTTDPVFSFTGTTNNSNIELNVDSALGNWSITDYAPDTYQIFSNATGTNSSKTSGAYTSGTYYNWSYANTNTSNLGKVIFIQVIANDTSGNSDSSIVYYTVVDTTAPVLTYDGTSTTNNSNVQYGGTILANWSITETIPDKYQIWSNATGTNSSKTSGSYNSGDYKSWSYAETNVTNINKTVFIQLKANDTSSNLGSSIAYFNIVDTTDPILTYVGDTNNTNREFGTAFTANWTVVETAPDYHYLWSNSTGNNVTQESGVYTNGQALDWVYPNTNTTNIGQAIFIQAFVNDTSGNSDSSIVYVNIIETVAPVLSYAGATNNSQVHLGTAILGNWSLSDTIPDTFIIWSNSTGTNSSKSSGAYTSGLYYNWSYTNTNISNVGLIVFIQLYCNDTQGNHNSSIVYFTIYNDTPALAYTGTTNNTNIEWESGGTFLARWTVTEGSPHWYIIFWNSTGSNTTYGSASYANQSALSGSYNPGLADIGNLIFFQLVCNDTYGNTNSSVVYFTVTNTDAPTVTINYPQNATYTGGSVQIWIASSNLDVAVFWWALYFSNTTLQEGNTTWTETVERDLSNGGYYLTGYANDTAGLEGSSTVYFTMAEGAVVSGGSGGIGVETQVPDLPIPQAPTVTTVKSWIPQVFMIGMILGGVYIVNERFGASTEPDKEFLEFKQGLRRDYIQKYYAAEQNKKKKRRKP